MIRCHIEFHKQKKKKSNSTAIKEGQSEVPSNLLCSFEGKRQNTLPVHWTFSVAPYKNPGQMYQNPLKPEKRQREVVRHIRPAEEFNSFVSGRYTRPEQCSLAWPFPETLFVFTLGRQLF
jgi:hypothetical protein